MKKRDKIILGIIAGTVCALIPIVFLSLAGRSKAVMAPAQVVMVEEETSEEVTEVESTEDMESFDETIETMPDEETTEEASTYEETQSETKVFEETSASNETSETQPSTEAQTEAVKETQKETVKETTVAETTKAVETVPETTTAAPTKAAKTNTGNWSVSGEVLDDVMAQGNSLINVYESSAEYNYGDITLNKSGNEYTFDIKINLSKSTNRSALQQLSRLTAINGVGDLLLNDNDNEVYQLDTWQDMGNGHQVYVSQSGKTLTYKIK